MILKYWQGLRIDLVTLLTAWSINYVYVFANFSMVTIMCLTAHLAAALLEHAQYTNEKKILMIVHSVASTTYSPLSQNLQIQSCYF